MSEDKLEKGMLNIKSNETDGECNLKLGAGTIISFHLRKTTFFVVLFLLLSFLPPSERVFTSWPQEMI